MYLLCISSAADVIYHIDMKGRLKTDVQSTKANVVIYVDKYHIFLNNPLPLIKPFLE